VAFDRYDKDLIHVASRLGATTIAEGVELRSDDLSTTGTLGVLLDAGEAGLVDPPQAYRQLIEETTFRTSPALEAHFLRRFLQEWSIRSVDSNDSPSAILAGPPSRITHSDTESRTAPSGVG
jgi:hypothetical protein